jgi:RNA polymerase-binding protein DksA
MGRKSERSCTRSSSPAARREQRLDAAVTRDRRRGDGTEMDQYAQIQAQLLAKQAELTHRLERIKENLTGGRSADSQEQAQELENAEVVDALGNEARSEISRIAKALDQIKNKTYGVCADCGETIPMARLEAYPFADRCIRCATAAEAPRRKR